MEVQNKSHILTKAEFIYVFTLLEGQELPEEILDIEQALQYSKEMTMTSKYLERKGVLSIGFDGIAQVNADLRRCVNTLICKDNYYLIKWDHNGSSEGSCYYFVLGEDYCEMSLSEDGEHYELTMLFGVHVLASRIIERFIDCLLCENESIRGVWIGHFEQINGEWNATKQFFAGAQEEKLWISDTTPEAEELIAPTTISQILNHLDAWMSDIY